MLEKVPLTGAQTFLFYYFFGGRGEIHAYIPVKLIPETKTQNENGKCKKKKMINTPWSFSPREIKSWEHSWPLCSLRSRFIFDSLPSKL